MFYNPRVSFAMPGMLNQQGMLDCQARAERQLQSQEYNLRLANKIVNKSRNANSEPLTVTRAEAQLRQLLKRRAALESTAPQNQSMETIHERVAEFHARAERLHERDTRYHFLFPELSSPPSAHAGDYRPPEPRPKPRAFWGWENGPKFTGTARTPVGGLR